MGKQNDFKEARVNNDMSQLVVELLSLTSGLTMAVDSLKPGEISDNARKSMSDIIYQTYSVFAAKIAFSILRDKGLLGKEVAAADLLYQFDLPDDDHDDLIILYKPKN